MADVAIAKAPPKLAGSSVTGPSSSDELVKIIKIFGIVVLIVGIPAALFMRWDWLSPSFQESNGHFPVYGYMFLHGLVQTIFLLVFSCGFGMLLAIPIGLVQVTGPTWLAWLARGFCNVMRGTPLLIQLWLLYYGVGSLFPSIPWIRESFLWPVLREAYPYALLAFTINFAGYEGEIMRGAFKSVPKGELEAARAFGMSPFTVLRRVWFPRAFHTALPTLSGEVVLQLKTTPLAATVTIFDVFAVGTKVRQDLLVIYEPLLFIALIYVTLTAVVVVIFRYLENLVPARRA